MNLSVTRRSFISAVIGLAVGLSSSWMLTGCSPAESKQTENQDNLPNSDDPSSVNPFDPESFSIPEALGNTYQQALAKVQEVASDAILFALRFSHVCTPEQPIRWDYMFASQSQLTYYIVFTGDVISVSELGECTMKFSEWENVPSIERIRVDAGRAYDNICASIHSMAEPSSLYAYLILYSEEADTAPTDYSYVDEPLTWYFEFGFTDEPGALVEQEDTSNAESTSEENTETLIVYAVDAVSGEARCIVE